MGLTAVPITVRRSKVTHLLRLPNNEWAIWVGELAIRAKYAFGCLRVETYEGKHAIYQGVVTRQDRKSISDQEMMDQIQHLFDWSEVKWVQ